MNVCRNIITGSRLFPENDAIVFEGQRMTYAELEHLSGKAAQVLIDNGVERGDRVGLLLGNTPACVVWYYACLRIGGVAVAVNTRLTGEEMAFVLSDCGTKLVVGTDELLEVLGDHECGVSVRLRDSAAEEAKTSDRFVETKPDDPATILYTSGTTGFPKGATLSHQNVCATVHAFNHLCKMETEDRLLLSVPLFHCYGQNAILNSGLNVGATIYLQRRFDLKESIQLIRDHKITKLFGVPATFQMLLDACSPEDLASIDYCFSAAATLPPQVSLRWLDKFGMPIYEGYGLTETAPFASYNHRLKYIPGSIGMPVDLVEMKIVDTETGGECPPGTAGEIAIRGPNVMLGYWNRPEETAEAVKDGWFHSGDIGTMDENGYFYIVDRVKDMIVVGGLKVYPSEVERVLLDFPRIKECAVVGAPDRDWGEKVVAFVVAEGEMDAEKITAFAREHLANYKVPTNIVFAEQLPRNPAGKILKTELRDQVAEDGDPELPAEPGPLIEKLRETHAASQNRLIVTTIQEEIQSLTGSDHPPATDALFMDMGMDSLMMVGLNSRLQIQVGSELELPSTLVFDHPTVDGLAEFLLEALTAPKGETPTSDHSPESSSIDEMSEEEALAALEKELTE